MSAAEQWRDVVGYEGWYQVSDRGRVASIPRFTAGADQRIQHRGSVLLTPTPTKGGHLRVSLSRAGERRTFRVHRLVLMAFSGPPPKGLICCHGDGDPTNNHLSNLRWDTYSANALDSVRHGSHAMANKTQCDQGHPLDGYDAKRNFRSCRTCRNARNGQRRARQEAAS